MTPNQPGQRPNFQMDIPMMWPSEDSEMRWIIRREDWARIKHRVDNIADPNTKYKDWAHTLFGVAFGLAAALVVWVVSGLIENWDHAHTTLWVAIILGLGFGTVASFLMCRACFAFDRSHKKTTSETVAEVVYDMERVEATLVPVAKGD